MVYVYLLECKDGSLYAGITTDLQKRLREHRTGKGAKYTRGRSPLVLRYAELQLDRSSALRRELQVKKLSRKQKEELIAAICLLPHADVQEGTQFDASR